MLLNIFVFLLVPLILILVSYLFFKFGNLYDAIAMFFYRGAPYVATSTEKLKAMIDLADLKKTDLAADLGSGDGRIVFRLAKHVKHVIGYEVNPFLYNNSIKVLETKHPNLRKKIAFKKLDFMKEDLSKYNVVFVYGINFLMNRLGKKLRKELKKGSKVVSNYYHFPNWKATKQINGVSLYIVD